MFVPVQQGYGQNPVGWASPQQQQQGYGQPQGGSYAQPPVAYGQPAPYVGQPQRLQYQPQPAYNPYGQQQ